MTDFWGVLLQTLTASGAAVLLLAVKLLFRDKLPPRWQFAIWGVLALVLLLPAGWGGRYVLLNWPLVVELFKSAVTGGFGTLTRVAAPIPLVSFAAPETVWDWLFLIYAAGAAALLLRYVISYVRLRLVLRKGTPIQSEQVRAVADRYHLPVCPVVVVDGLPTAFICGVFKPVLALPAGTRTDDKVILHELLHLKHRDVVWGWVIALFRCLHWCNPLIWLCADWAANDLESLCDYRVLARLEGEDRRDYGRILLSMADEKYARTPGTSSAANGGKNIRRRIESIARFKRYPAGMALASVCVAVVLATPLIVGARADTVEVQKRDTFPVRAMAAARTTWCATPAGALDAYAKSMLTGNIAYRAMCAPLAEQDELAEGCVQNSRTDSDWLWEYTGLPCWPQTLSGYRIFNLRKLEDSSCEGLLALELRYPPNGQPRGDEGIWLALQPVRVEREGSRWVVVPLDGFWTAASEYESMPDWNFDGMPARVYTGQAEDFTITARWQTWVSLCKQAGGSKDLTPVPDGQFDYAYVSYQYEAAYTGSLENRADFTRIGLSCAPYEGDERPVLTVPGERRRDMYLDDAQAGDTGLYSSGGSSSGESWENHPLDSEWWSGVIPLSGGGTTFNWDRDGDWIPHRIAADWYLNGELAAELDLLPVEGSEFGGN